MTTHRSIVPIRFLFRHLFAIGLAAHRLSAQGTTPHADLVPRHDTLTVLARALGEARLINVYTPPGYDAAFAVFFPTLYMPDGGLDEDFAHIVRSVDSLIALGAIRPTIVVGIPNTERRRDLTGPTRVATDSTIAPRVGGSAVFRQFIRDELIPTVRSRYRTTEERTIVGESLAGLFVLETLLTEPVLFTHYVALDPSLWWNGGALVDSAAVRLAALEPAPRTLYLTNSNVPEIAAITRRFATVIESVPPPGLSWVYAPRPELTHATIFLALGPRVLARALR